eukprot:5942609-Prymnesium_polylepis.1
MGSLAACGMAEAIVTQTLQARAHLPSRAVVDGCRSATRLSPDPPPAYPRIRHLPVPVQLIPIPGEGGCDPT